MTVITSEVVATRTQNGTLGVTLVLRQLPRRAYRRKLPPGQRVVTGSHASPTSNVTSRTPQDGGSPEWSRQRRRHTPIRIQRIVRAKNRPGGWNVGHTRCLLYGQRSPYRLPRPVTLVTTHASVIGRHRKQAYRGTGIEGNTPR